MEGVIKSVVTRPAMVQLENAEVIKGPEKRQGNSGSYVTMRVRVAKDIGKKESIAMTVNAYDEWVARIIEKMILKTGDYVSGKFILAPYPRSIPCKDMHGNNIEIVSTDFSLKVVDIYLSCYQQRKEEMDNAFAPSGEPDMDFSAFGG